MTDRYRHLLEWHETEAAASFDDYLANVTGAQRGAHPPTGSAAVWHLQGV
jgi:hypothetical protein